MVDVLVNGQRTGQLRLRVTHGDPKLDNSLFSQNNCHALALIDSGTVQPGLIQHEFGDCLLHLA
ncbi:hypothetical protein CKO09_10675 [Chromatium weissei]|nr:hypothetical protein [Chromatium weissei]